VKELPDKSEFELYCPMSDKQKSEYQKILKSGEAQFEGDYRNAAKNKRMHFFAMLTRLRQISCDPALITEIDCAPEQSGKLALLNDRLQELSSSKHKVVVFSQFVQLIKRAMSFCGQENQAKFFSLTGRTRDREAVVNQFQEHDGPAVIFVSLRAGGTGITLHAADYVFLLDPWWNPAVEAQAIDRVHRIGQGKPVFVYRLISRGTIEEQIQLLKKEKRELFDNIVQEDEDGVLMDDLVEIMNETSQASK